MSWFKDLLRPFPPVEATPAPAPPSAVSIEPVVTVEASVGRRPDVTLYDADGRHLTVAAADVEHFLGLGYRRSRWLPEEATVNLMPLFDAARDAVSHALAHAQETGRIASGESGPMALAETAMAALITAWREAHQSIHGHYPVEEGRPVCLLAEQDIFYQGKLIAAKGETFNVDPTQAEYWRGMGAVDD